MPSSPPATRPFHVLLSLGVHFYTSAGLLAALMSLHFIMTDDYKRAFYWMFVAVVIDATDGTLARAANVKHHVPWIDGRKLDDIVDFVNYTFVPIFMVWHAEWLPEPAWLFCSFPLVASVFAFVREGAKQEERGFFQGFPSYWNIVVFYIALLHEQMGAVGIAAILVFLSVLCVTPMGFVYPNRAPRWKLFFLGGAAIWAAILLIIVGAYPTVPRGWILVSLIYPILYVVLSLYLDWRDRFHWI
jgi:phosphatidylcholine synthase